MAQKVVPMIHVPDVRATVDWYKSIGFKVLAMYSDDENDGESFAMVSFGVGEVMFSSGGQPSTQRRREVDLYVYVENVDELYHRLKDRVEVVEGLYDTFYGMREFIIRDNNRFWITFGQPAVPRGAVDGNHTVSLRDSDMSDRPIEVFFYGLFMDDDVLRNRGIVPVNPRPATVDGFGLRIGKRATLVPARHERAYGMVMRLTQQQLEKLYSAPGLEHYQPEAVACMTLSGEPVCALCYNLPKAPAPDEVNEEYAGQLRSVLAKLGFPEEYVERVR